MDLIEQSIERVLVIKAQMGDRAALEELYRRFNPRLGYYLRRVLDRDDVTDTQQEIWLTVLRQLGKLRAAEAFTVWLYRIARAKAINRLSARVLHESIHEADVDLPAEDEGEQRLSPEEASALHDALKKLKPAHREVLVLRFLEDLSYEQMAQVIGCSVGTVRSRIHYAKDALRREMENSHE